MCWQHTQSNSTGSASLCVWVSVYSMHMKSSAETGGKKDFWHHYPSTCKKLTESWNDRSRKMSIEVYKVHAKLAPTSPANSLVKWNLFWLATNSRDRYNSVKCIAIIPVQQACWVKSCFLSLQTDWSIWSLGFSCRVMAHVGDWTGFPWHELPQLTNQPTSYFTINKIIYTAQIQPRRFSSDGSMVHPPTACPS